MVQHGRGILKRALAPLFVCAILALAVGLTWQPISDASIWWSPGRTPLAGAIRNEEAGLPQTYNYMGRVPNIRNFVHWMTVLEDGRVLGWQELMAQRLAMHPTTPLESSGAKMVTFAGQFRHDVLWSGGRFDGGTALSAMPGAINGHWQSRPSVGVQINDGVDLVSGGNFRLVLRKDGTVWGFGGNEYGQLGTMVNDWQGNDLGGPVMNLAKVVAVAAGFRHAIALRKDGTVWEWGSNNLELARNVFGTYPGPPREHYFAPHVRRVEGLPRIVGIASGDHHNVALDVQGNVWAWGNSAGGRLGVAARYSESDDPRIDAPTPYIKAPIQVPGMSGVKQIVAAGGHTLALRNDGTVWAWGISGNGQLGEPEGVSQAQGLMDPDRRVVYRIGGIHKVRKIFASRLATALVQEDDGLWFLGMGPWFYFPFTVAVRGEPGAMTKVKFFRSSAVAAHRLARASEFGIYRVDDSFGRVGKLRPGEEGYPQAALSPERAIPVFPASAVDANESRAAKPQEERTLPLKAGEMFAFYAIVNSSVQAWRTQRPNDGSTAHSQAIFSYPAANAGGKMMAESSAKTATYDSVTLIWNMPGDDGAVPGPRLGLTGIGLDPLPHGLVQKEALAEAGRGQ